MNNIDRFKEQIKYIGGVMVTRESPKFLFRVQIPTGMLMGII